MKVKTIKGTGRFYNDSREFVSSFEVVFYPYRTIVYPDDFGFVGFTESYWKLDGTLEDNRPISSDKLLQGGVGNSSFYAFELNVNCQKEVHEFAEFPLIGFYDSEINLSYKNFEVEIKGEKSFSEERSNYKNLRVASEGSVLKIKRQESSKKELLDFAILICKLLSIATANDVVFHKQIFDGEEIVHRNMRGNYYGFTKIIPQNQNNAFLENTIESWMQLNSEERNVMNDIVNYINSAGDEYDYLDDRIFRLAQCWEISANNWIEKDDELPDDLNALRGKLKRTCRDWRKEIKEDGRDDPDPNGFWTGRVLNSLHWISFISNIERLITSKRLKQSKLNIDLEKLKNNVRDKVAHEGRMIPFENLNGFFDEVMFGLRLVLLSKLEYKGMVEYKENGWKAQFDIKEFFE